MARAGFKNSTDVLIAKFVYANAKGTMDAGEKVVTGRYPLSSQIDKNTTYGTFGVNIHTVDQVVNYGYGIELRCATSDASPYVISFIRNSGNQYEFYGKYYSGPPVGSMSMVDNSIGDYKSIYVGPNSPSMPDTEVSIFYTAVNDDDAYLDVDIY